MFPARMTHIMMYVSSSINKKIKNTNTDNNNININIRSGVKLGECDGTLQIQLAFYPRHQIHILVHIILFC